MKDIVHFQYDIAIDMLYLMDAERLNIEELSNFTKLSKHSIYNALNGVVSSKETYEKFYSYAYKLNFRFNNNKEKILKKLPSIILFHGSKYGIKNIDCNGSRRKCDFGSGFYLGESYSNAKSFVSEYEDSSVYTFRLIDTDLNILKFDCDLEWMLAICYCRGQLDKYKDFNIIKEIIKKVENADVIVAPIADNRMFFIMTLFTNGDINCDVALHTLHASNLGFQYVIKSELALERLSIIDKLYLCEEEKKENINHLIDRSNRIEEELKKAQRLYRNGLFIEEVLK